MPTPMMTPPVAADPVVFKQCDAKADDGDDDGENQGNDRQAEIVTRAPAWVIGQHGNEVRRPDTASGGGGIQAHPDQARSTKHRLGPVE